MAPVAHKDGDMPITATVLGTIGTGELPFAELSLYSITGTALTPPSVCILFSSKLLLWCIQVVPQIWTNWRTKKTDGLPGLMMFMWTLSGVPFGIYAIVQKFNVPLQIQPHMFSGLCLICWGQILRYHRKWATWKATFMVLFVGAVFGSIETALILILRPLHNKGNNAPMFVLGVLAAVLLGGGLLPPYREIWKRRGRVIGINWLFLAMDWSGSFCSLMALVAQNTFDVLGGVIYIVICLLEMGIGVSHLTWLFRTGSIRKEAAAQGKTFDDILAEHEANGTPFKFAERKSRRQQPRQQVDEEAKIEGSNNSKEFVSGSSSSSSEHSS